LLRAPKQSRRRQSAQKTVLREISAGSGAPLKLMAGRYGPYVTDGTTNASLPRGVAPESLTYEQALELLAARRDAAPMPRRTSTRRRGAGAAARTGGRARKAVGA
jgi:DNA topoisomerase I